MSIKDKILRGTDANLHVSFDVGHSSIGWAVLEKVGQQASDIKINGCGVVTFGADDCLASKRRDYRRQRRHARSTRQRIERMEKLLAHLKIFTPEQLKEKHRQAGGHSAPWLLAARVLATNDDAEFLLDWPELWNVLRWYAHNRGYDGNARWSNVSEDALTAAEQDEKKSGTEKEQNAIKLMNDYGKQTMAETVFADLFAEFKITDPTKVKTLPYLQKHFKGNQCAFPRKTVEAEVLKILQAHKFCDAKFTHLLLARQLSEEDRSFLKDSGISLPKRFEGGLLFGQLVPRFENRIIAECPITSAQEYERLISKGETHEEAKRKGRIAAKVPGKHCHEFLEFRWAMTLANVRIGFGDEKYEDDAKLRPLTANEIRKVDARVRRLGFLKLEPDKPGKDGLVRVGKNELRSIVIEETKCDRHNLDALLLHPDAKEGLKLLPVKGDTTAFRVAWGCFDNPKDENGKYHDDPLRHRFTTQLLRGKKDKPRKLTIQKILDDLIRLKKTDAAERLLQAAKQEAQGKKIKLEPDKLNALLNSEFYCDKLNGRARFSRKMLKEAVQQIFNKSEPIHPLEKGGCLEQTEEIKRAALEKPLDEQTNNHLVRHRLLILQRLHNHIVQDFAAGDKSRISRITVEVARDLQTMSGLTNKEKAKELTGKLKQHKEIASGLAEKLKNERDENGRPFVVSPGLIRKARVADDLKWECPYTGRTIEPAFLVHRSYDKDHVIPRSKRLSDALEALVITSREVNGEKKARTALQFVKEINQPENRAKRDKLGIRTEAQFRAFVDSLWPKSDPFKRARAGGNRATDDEARCWRRKQLLLTESWEEKEFTPADLTKTRHITKLAAQQLEAAFKDLPEPQRPAIISITGAVTATFRDKTWKLLPLLGSANTEINKLHQQKIEAEKTGHDFNFKKAVREVTHLHHALDAISLGLVTALLVPQGDAGRAGLNGDLARLIHKGKLTDEERNKFEALRHQLGLPKFYRWAAGRCDEDKQQPFAGQGGILCIDELPESIKRQICERLIEKRIVQHIPADMSGLKVEENTRGIAKIENGRIHLRQQKRDEKTGKLSHNLTDEFPNKLIGFTSNGVASKLKAVKGVRVITDNFGVAILDHATEGEAKFSIIPWHKVWPRLQELKARNAGKQPRILRIGTLIRVSNPKNKDYKGVWMIRGAQLNQRAGYLVDISEPDVIEYRVPKRKDCKQNVGLKALVQGGLEILKAPLTGINSSPLKPVE
jgi:CRISPR-associated endonuclease Csn1